jgi:aerobic-type carbon monoxide dehydrogenase small subunit (CoxS/CutS family)
MRLWIRALLALDLARLGKYGATCSASVNLTNGWTLPVQFEALQSIGTRLRALRRSTVKVGESIGNCGACDLVTADASTKAQVQTELN